MAKAVIVLDSTIMIDATRTSFLEELRKYYAVYMINFPEPENADLKLIDALIAQITVNKDTPTWILSYNGRGICEEILDYAKARSVAVHLWYLDEPYSPAKALIRKDIFVHYACTGYVESALIADAAKSYWLPFSTIPPDFKANRTPPKPIFFLGTCWHVIRVAQHLAAGLICKTDDTVYAGQELYQRIASGDFVKHEWTTRSGLPLPSYQVTNAIASMRRVNILNGFEGLGIDIFGMDDWFYHLWSVAPNLIARAQFNPVTTQAQMKEMMGNYKVALNIFHVQNQNGGPNFRILDSAVNGTAILSDYNKHCAQLFPHKEAAMYFKNLKEGLDYADLLVKDEPQRRKLVKNAAEIVLEGHTHNHRIRRFTELSGDTLPVMSPHGLVITGNAGIQGEQNPVMPTPETSSFGKMEIFWSGYLDVVHSNAQYMEFLTRKPETQPVPEPAPQSSLCTKMAMFLGKLLDRNRGKMQ